MNKCPRCGTLNSPDAFRCKNENCSDILSQGKTEEAPNAKSYGNIGLADSNNVTGLNIFRVIRAVAVIIAVIVGACGLFWLYLNADYEARQRAESKAEAEAKIHPRSGIVKLKGGYLIAASKELLNKAQELRRAGDDVALNKLGETKLVMVTKEGAEAYIERVSQHEWYAEVRPKGEYRTFWVDLRAVWRD